MSGGARVRLSRAPEDSARAAGGGTGTASGAEALISVRRPGYGPYSGAGSAFLSQKAMSMADTRRGACLRGIEIVTTSCYVAKWSFRRRGQLVITDKSDAVVGSYPVDPDGDRPGPQLLWHTGWSSCPGAEWDEEPPDEWSISVFRHPLPRQQSGHGARPSVVNERQSDSGVIR